MSLWCAARGWWGGNAKGALLVQDLAHQISSAAAHMPASQLAASVEEEGGHLQGVCLSQQAPGTGWMQKESECHISMHSDTLNDTKIRSGR